LNRYGAQKFRRPPWSATAGFGNKSRFYQVSDGKSLDTGPHKEGAENMEKHIVKADGNGAT